MVSNAHDWKNGRKCQGQSPYRRVTIEIKEIPPGLLLIDGGRFRHCCRRLFVLADLGGSPIQCAFAQE